MTREIISTDRAPDAVGPYSQAVVSGDLVFTAGQIALDPETQTMVEGGVEAQARRVLQNLGAVLEAAGCSFADVIKTTLYFQDLADFAAVNAIYAEFFGDDPPARSAVEVARLPKDAKVEIDVVARRP